MSVIRYAWGLPDGEGVHGNEHVASVTLENVDESGISCGRYG